MPDENVRKLLWKIKMPEELKRYGTKIIILGKETYHLEYAGRLTGRPCKKCGKIIVNETLIVYNRGEWSSKHEETKRVWHHLCFPIEYAEVVDHV